MSTNDQLLEQIPQAHRERFIEICSLTDHFCDQHLDDEFKDICRRMIVYLCDENSPAMRGKAASWASGVMAAVAQINFLADPSRTPCLTQEMIAKEFGVSTATLSAKKRQLDEGLDLNRLDPEFSTSRLQEMNPLIWFLEVDGLLFDVRTTPREFQELAFNEGLIPYIPADREDGPVESQSEEEESPERHPR